MSSRLYATSSLVFFLLVFSFVPVAASVISGGDTGNLSAPLDDPGWGRVGRVGTNGSGVYLGNGWVITANHVSTKTYFTVEGDPTYQIIDGPGNGVRLQNPAPPPDTFIDYLYMFRIDVSGSNLNGLGDLQITSAAPSSDTQGVHIGTGEGQTSPTYSNGYTWAGDASRDTRWNYQDVYNSNQDFWGMEGFVTDFEQRSNYGMAADNDSGSGLFVKNDTTWELAGIAHAVGNMFNGQPSGTARYGNWSFYSDLSAYSDQISQTLATTPMPEPATLGLLLLGSLALLRRHRP